VTAGAGTRGGQPVGRDGQPVPDVIAPGLAVLFCGINPGCTSARLHQHFARRGNRFWPALHQSGFTPRALIPAEQFALLDYGLGVTNLASRGTATAAELARAELVEGGQVLERKARRFRPSVVAVVGVTAYRMAFARPKAVVGPQEERLAESRLWVLPNPSGLNAHYQLPDLVREFRRLRQDVSGALNGS
jgi:double-stranded uracil-DNA glycosylase